MLFLQINSFFRSVYYILNIHESAVECEEVFNITDKTKQSFRHPFFQPPSLSCRGDKRKYHADCFNQSINLETHLYYDDFKMIYKLLI